MWYIVSALVGVVVGATGYHLVATKVSAKFTEVLTKLEEIVAIIKK